MSVEEVTDGTAKWKALSLLEAYKKIEALETALAEEKAKLTDYCIVQQWTEQWGTSDTHFSSAPDVDGYKFLCWVNFTSNGTILPIYTDASTRQKNVEVFCYNPDLIKGYKVDCIAMYIREG